jgi:hypothetical protein
MQGEVVIHLAGRLLVSEADLIFTIDGSLALIDGGSFLSLSPQDRAISRAKETHDDDDDYDGDVCNQAFLWELEACCNKRASCK